MRPRRPATRTGVWACSALVLLCIVVTSPQAHAQARRLLPGGTSQVPQLRHHLYMLPSVTQVRATLRQPAGFQLTSTPLADALSSIGQGYHLNIWLDRRVDPNIAINLRGGGEPLGKVLEAIARLAGAELAVVENVVYIGPQNVPRRVAAASAALYNELHTSGHAAANRSTDLKWMEASTPDELLDQLPLKLSSAASAEMLPYDLWRGGEFYRESSVATLLCVIAAGFDREFMLSTSRRPAQFATAPLRTQTKWMAVIPKEALSAAQLAELEQAAGADLTGGRDGWRLTSDYSLHLLSGSAATKQNRPRPGRPRDTASNSGRVSGDIAGPLDDVVRQLSAMNGFKVNWAEAIAEKERTQVIKIRVANATFEDVLSELSRASNLSLILDKQTVSISRNR